MTLDCSAPHLSALLGLQGLQCKDTGFDDRTSPSHPRAQAQTSLLRYQLTYMGNPPGKQAATAAREPSSSASPPRSLAARHRGPWPLSRYFRYDLQADRQQAKAHFRPAKGQAQPKSQPPREKQAVCTPRVGPA